MATEQGEAGIEGLEVGPGYASADPDELPSGVIEVDEGPSGRRYKVHADLEDDLIDITELRPWTRNPRNGDVERIAFLLDTHGQFRPIGVNKGTFSKKYEPNMIGFGNHTYMAALSLGWTHIAKTWLDVDDTEFEEIAIADNAASDAAWNDKALLLEVIDEGEIDPRRAGLNTKDMDDLRSSQEDNDQDEEPPPEEGEDQSGELESGYEIIVQLATEEAQAELLERLLEEGYQCKALM